MTGDAANAEPEPDAGVDAWFDLDRSEGNVVGILQHRNGAGAIESDVELAGEPVERAVIEDVEMPFARIGARVEQLLWIDTCGGRAGDVADVVGARATRT